VVGIKSNIVDQFHVSSEREFTKNSVCLVGSIYAQEIDSFMVIGLIGRLM
jgi:hypothetical protein